MPVGAERQPGFTACIVVCGTRGNADALANLILFAPLGAALALCGRTGFRPVFYAGLLSAGIELAQTVIPGRDPSVSDVCFNTLGAAAGQMVARGAGTWTLPEERIAARLTVGASAVATLVFGLTGWLLAPDFPASTYRARWTRDLPEHTWYHGRVLRVTLGSLTLDSNDRIQSEVVRPLLLAEVRLRVTATAGQRAPELGSLFSIHDNRHREILLLGPDRDDLVLRYRTRAAALRLDQPDLRLPGVLARAVRGDTLRIEAWREGGSYCLALHRTTICGLGFTIGSGWALLLYPEHLSPGLQELLSAAWIAGLVLPVGLWTRRRPETLLSAGLLVIGLFVLPRTVGLLPTPPMQLLGAGGGWLLGVGFQMRLRGAASRSSRRAPRTSCP